MSRFVVQIDTYDGVWVKELPPFNGTSPEDALRLLRVKYYEPLLKGVSEDYLQKLGFTFSR